MRRVGIVVILGRVHDTLVVGNNHENIGLVRLAFLRERKQAGDHQDRNRCEERKSSDHFFHLQRRATFDPERLYFPE